MLICEGWATGRTLAEKMPNCLVLAAIDAGNLAAVAKATRQAWPTLEVVICGDDDRQTKGNPGKTAARAAADAANCRFALPKFPHDAPQHLSDFNDLASWQRGPYELYEFSNTHHCTKAAAPARSATGNGAAV